MKSDNNQILHWRYVFSPNLVLTKLISTLKPMKGSKYIGLVFAGFPSPADDYREEDIDVEELLGIHSTSVYYARVKGDSMIGAHIPDNAIIVIDKARKPRQNSVIVGTLNGENLLKHYIRTDEGIFLAPNNPQFATIAVTEDMDFSVWGVVIRIIIDSTKPKK